MSGVGWRVDGVGNRKSGHEVIYERSAFPLAVAISL
jgi:hypothetical protein